MVRLFAEYGRKNLPFFVVGLLASVLNRLVGIVPALVLGVAIDAVFFQNTAYALPLVPQSWIPETVTGQFWLSFWLVIVAFVAGVGLSWVQGLGLAVYSNRVQHAVRVDTYDVLQRLDMTFFDDKQTGQVLSILDSDVRNLRTFLDSTLSGGLQLVVSVVGIAGVLFYLNAQLAVVTLVAVPLLAVFTVWFMRTIRPMYRALRESVGALNTRIENNVAGMEVIKASTTEEYETARVADASMDYYTRALAVVRLDYLYQPTMELLAGVAFAATFAIGGLWLILGPPWPFTGQLLVGEFVTFLFMTQRFIDPLSGAGRIVNAYENARASGERIFGLTDRDVTVRDSSETVALGTVAGRIEFDHVSFAYATGREVLHDVSFAAAPGETVALVGPTGAGKSTAAKLLLRLYDTTGGSVRVDGHDVRDVSIQRLREAMGYVSQDVYLFDGTVRENLLYGAFEATEAEMVAAATAAEAHDFVSHLPDGYDTRIGERGVKLSGGQRQRLSIARAMLQNPRILVLDEATSAVDTETELLIQRALDRLTEGRTTLVIAHRLSTIRHADTIVVLDEGRVVESGTHDELVAEGGLYATLWSVQAGDTSDISADVLDRLVDRVRVADIVDEVSADGGEE
ncbi:ABC transporter ATP-binding protein [Haloferax profundi]|uniref:Multidrug ABC transporter ATP-binding protein n=1 Tax=Haloferax profundi TaxID=1544718 RepID=A0A0W1SVF9_9EURY|nr:ABC transporter ATP-binding protein [Haloferax profundi]KTG30438.1 multidrug ABC transporter ATP-binding protein [Haloferax profundi]